jgi:hypothetical protein
MMHRLRSAEPPPVYSLGILIDGAGPETHLEYRDEYLGQGVRFSFPVIQLDGWRDRAEALRARAPSNPFAVVILAQLAANEHPDKATRLRPKFELVRGLKAYGYDEESVRQIYRLVDWLITLPEDLEEQYQERLQTLSEEDEMTYVTTTERWGIKKGRLEGRAEGLQEGLSEGTQRGQAELLLRQVQRRFGALPDEVSQRIRTAAGPQLELWALNILDAATLEDVFRD